MNEEIVEMEEGFPRINGGFCDGMGCHWVEEQCWCTQHLESCKEYQRVFNKPWNWRDPECHVWEESWRWCFKRWVERE